LSLAGLRRLTMNCKDELISNRGGGPGLSNIEENIVFSEREREEGGGERVRERESERERERERDSKNVLEKTDKPVGRTYLCMQRLCFK